MALVNRIDSRLKARADDLEFNHKNARKLADRAGPPDRSGQEGDVFHEAAQFSDEQIRPMGSVLQQGVEFEIEPTHL